MGNKQCEKCKELTKERDALIKICQHASKWTGKLEDWAGKHGAKVSLEWAETSDDFRAVQAAIDKALDIMPKEVMERIKHEVDLDWMHQKGGLQ